MKKKLNQKEWGILGTSLGSFLIIVALLTMVGIGSGDSYAANSEEGYTWTCTEYDVSSVATSPCSSGTYDSSSQKCESTSGSEVCYTGIDAETKGNRCTDTNGCSYDGICSSGQSSWLEWTCPIIVVSDPDCGSDSILVGTMCYKKTTSQYPYKTVTNPADSSSTANLISCTCNDCPASETEQDTEVESFTCSKGTYPNDDSCTKCIAGNYCLGGTFEKGKSVKGSRAGVVKCPDGKTSVAGASSSDDCNISVEGEFVSCNAGQYYLGQGKCDNCIEGYYCPGGSFSMKDSSRDGIYECPDNATCTSTDFTCNSSLGYYKKGSACAKSSGGNPPAADDPDDGGNDSGNGGNDGNSGGNDNGNGSNTNTNPNTGSKVPLIIAMVGLMSVCVSIFTYHNSRNNGSIKSSVE